jgi:hypothetical protein
MKRIELLCFLLLVLALSMAYSGMAAAKPIIILAVCITIIFYLITGIGLTRNTFLPTSWKHTLPELRPALMMKTISGLVFALSATSIGFHELFISGFYWLSILSILMLTAVMFFSMRLLEDEQPKLNRGILVRSGILSIVITFYVVTPLSTRLSWRFDDAYYRDLIQFVMENPNDEDAQRELIDYERRMAGDVPFEPLE